MISQHYVRQQCLCQTLRQGAWETFRCMLLCTQVSSLPSILGNGWYCLLNLITSITIINQIFKTGGVVKCF